MAKYSDSLRALKFDYIMLIVLQVSPAYAFQLTQNNALKRLQPVGWTQEKQVRKSQRIYKKLYTESLSQFHNYNVNELRIRPFYGNTYEAARILRNPGARPNYCSLLLCNETPKTRCTIKGYLLRDTVDTLWCIENCKIKLPLFQNQYQSYSPQSYNEADFMVKRELAHIALATEVRYRVELDPTHYPGLLDSADYHWHSHRQTSFYKFYKILKPDTFIEHEVAATLLALQVGGHRVWKGGLQYISHQLIVTYRRQERLPRFSLSRNQKPAIQGAIKNHTEIIKAMLRWIYNTEKQDQRALTCYYRSILTTIPQFLKLSEQHKKAMYSLSTIPHSPNS